MNVVKQSVEMMAMTEEPLKLIERAGRTCYKSEAKITADSAERFVKKIIIRGHDSVLEHASMTVRIITDRGISHEIVRHRIGMSYSQESTRYVKYDGGIEVIKPPFLVGLALDNWQASTEDSQSAYIGMIKKGVSRQWARSVLPTCLKTEIVVTGNFRSWRHFLRLRMSHAAHPQIREIAVWISALLPPVIWRDLV